MLAEIDPVEVDAALVELYGWQELRQPRGSVARVGTLHRAIGSLGPDADDVEVGLAAHAVGALPGMAWLVIGSEDRLDEIVARVVLCDRLVTTTSAGAVLDDSGSVNGPEVCRHQEDASQGESLCDLCTSLAELDELFVTLEGWKPLPPAFAALRLEMYLCSLRARSAPPSASGGLPQVIITTPSIVATFAATPAATWTSGLSFRERWQTVLMAARDSSLNVPAVPSDDAVSICVDAFEAMRA